MTLNPLPASIRTPFNLKQIKSTPDTRRVLVKGRWQRTDEAAAKAYRWLKGAAN